MKTIAAVIAVVLAGCAADDPTATADFSNLRGQWIFTDSVPALEPDEAECPGQRGIYDGGFEIFLPDSGGANPVWVEPNADGLVQVSNSIVVDLDSAEGVVASMVAVFHLARFDDFGNPEPDALFVIEAEDDGVSDWTIIGFRWTDLDGNKCRFTNVTVDRIRE